ncbi:class I SAM-dependent methyltransferase [Streptomyces alboflavus]|uniref:class I SAM-dependent methyltransferase n=1 Tax=Streptomyces alboflavus TaxID=67267 RepID=UPI0005275565|nr:class I SAM-dependent methyltransferase [Streptomyces alboflavus]
MDEQQWRRFLGHYHDTHAGITEQLLTLAEPLPYAWLAEPLHTTDGIVVDLACGSAPTRALLPDTPWVGVDSSAGELAEAARRGRLPLIRASADALPLRSGTVGAVCASMCLPVLTPLPRVLDEIRRVLRPGGTLAVLVPSQSGLTPSGALAWIRVMTALRAVHQPWPNPQARDQLAALLGELGFAVRADEHRVFTLRLDTPEATALLVDGLYLPRLTPHRAQAAKRALAAWARPGRRIELPLRRVIAERPIASASG